VQVKCTIAVTIAETLDSVTLCGLATYLYPPTGLLKGMATWRPYTSEVPGSGEGQLTGTVDDYHRMDRREAEACGLLLSS
jgi:hypothetical protein